MSDLPASWVAALEKRRALPGFDEPDSCVRLLHDEVPGLRCDRYGQVCWFYRYTDDAPTAAETARYDALTARAGAAHWHAHDMHDRGRDPGAGAHRASAEAPDTWQAGEGDLRFELRAGSGQSPGLFLDQRDNRAWVSRAAADKSVLNLFAYTGGFGVAALTGGAAGVVQVDVSRPYLDWARVNAGLNGVDDERCEYSAVDARLLLEGCRKRGRTFDGIVCDPPSFGRGGRRGRGVFRVEQDLPDLLRAAAQLLAPGGWILVSSNFAGWTQPRFEEAVAVSGLQLDAAPGPGADCRGDEALRSCLLRR